MMLFRAAPTPASTPIPVNSRACHKCGTDVAGSAEEAQQRIEDLESQVRALNEKAAAAVDKLADYEDELQSLRARCARLGGQQQQSQQPQQPARQTTPVSQTPELFESPSPVNNNLQVSPPRASSRLASLSSFFGGRQRETPTASTPVTVNLPPSSNAQFNQSTPNLVSPHPLSATTTTPINFLSRTDQPPTPVLNLQSLQSTLESERSRRLQAETSLTQTQTELEELTAQLFGQANEMVAAERKARYKLEERVKVLENRDGEKRRRLERLEKALQRIERVRGLVERRNTVNGYGAAASLDIPNSSSEDGDGQHDRTPSEIPSKSSTKIDIKRKAVATPIATAASDSPRDKRDRERTRIDRKGTV